MFENMCLSVLANSHSTALVLVDMEGIIQASVPDLNGNVRSEFVSTSVIRDVHKLLKSCFNQAVKWDMMEKNPAFKAMVPKHKSKKVSKIL